MNNWVDTYSSKLSGEHSRNGSIIATPALLTKPSNTPKELITSLVLSQSRRSMHAVSIDGYSTLMVFRLSGWLDMMTTSAPCFHNSRAIPRPMPIWKMELIPS